jgi:uncharacterized alkaline shock family protein YloU
MSDFSADKTASGPGPFTSTPLSPLPDEGQHSTGEREREASPAPTGAPGSAGSSGSPGSIDQSGPAGASPGFAAPPSTAPPLASAPGPGPVSTPATSNGTQRFTAEVKGRIEVADEVVEKVAGLAAMEVEGVADLGGDIARAIESVRERIGIGQKRGDQGIKARISGRDVAIDVTIMIEYGHVVMDVAREVKHNVAVQANRMLGLRVVEVNVTVDDVRMPRPPGEEDEAAEEFLSLDR